MKIAVLEKGSYLILSNETQYSKNKNEQLSAVYHHLIPDNSVL